MGLFKRKLPEGDIDPTGPITFNNSGTMQATNWPLGVPAKKQPQDIEAMANASDNTPGTRGGGFDVTSTDSPIYNARTQFYSDTEYQNVRPYNGEDKDYSTNLGPNQGLSSYFTPTYGNFPIANFNSTWRNIDFDTELLPGLDGDRYVPNPIIGDPGMSGDVGYYSPDYTINFNSTQPSWSSNTYVTTAEAGTYDSPGVPQIPSDVIMAASGGAGNNNGGIVETLGGM